MVFNATTTGAVNITQKVVTVNSNVEKFSFTYENKTTNHTNSVTLAAPTTNGSFIVTIPGQSFTHNFTTNFAQFETEFNTTFIKYEEVTLNAYNSQNTTMTADLDVVIDNKTLKMKNGEFKFTPIQNFTTVTLQYQNLVLVSANVSHIVNITNVTVPNVLKIIVNCEGNATLTHFNTTISCAKPAYFLAPLTNVTINISATGFNNANYSLNTST